MTGKSISGGQDADAGAGVPNQPEMQVLRVSSADASLQAKALFREYADGLGIDLCFQDFEGEMARWPGDYAPPRGALFLATARGALAGCAGLRSLGEDLAELKRLYVRLDCRGLGLGLALTRAVIAEAERLGYSRLRLDTLPQMTEARALYDRIGFRDIPPQGDHAAMGMRVMELGLPTGSQVQAAP